MPKPQGRIDSNKNRWALPEEFPTDFACAKVYIPDDQYYRTQLIGRLYTLQQQVWYDRDERKTARDVAKLWASANAKTMQEFGNGCIGDCPEPKPEIRKPRAVLPDCVSVSGNTITVRECECDEMVTINVYEGCGCGCEDGGKGGASGGASGGAESGIKVPNELVGANRGLSRCDIVSGFVPNFVAEFGDFLGDFDVALTAQGDALAALLSLTVGIVDITDITDNTARLIAETLEIALDGYIAAFDDPKLLLRVQENAWANLAGQSQFSSLTDQLLSVFVNSLPNLWGNALISGTVTPRLLGQVVRPIISRSFLNASFILSKGSADASLCEYLASVVGDVYEPPVDTLPEPFIEFDFIHNSISYKAIEVYLDEVVSLGEQITFDSEVGDIAIVAQGEHVPGDAANSGWKMFEDGVQIFDGNPSTRSAVLPGETFPSGAYTAFVNAASGNPADPPGGFTPAPGAPVRTYSLETQPPSFGSTTTKQFSVWRIRLA